MKNLILLVLLFSITSLLAQQKKASVLKYELSTASWEQFEELNEDGLYKDALNLLTPLLDQAINEYNPADFQKALNKYRDIVPDALLENDEKLALLNQLENKIDQTKVPLNNMGHLFLAQLYEHIYYQWDLYSDFNIMVNKNILKNSEQAKRYHYKQALIHIDKLINYDASMLHHYYGNDSITQLTKPTLLDFSLPNLNFYFTEQNYKDTNLFYKTEHLLKYPNDTLLSLYALLELHHLKTMNLYAYTETVLNRNYYITSNTSDPHKINYQWLRDIVNQHPTALRVILTQASQLVEEGERYDWKTNPVVKNKKEEAVKLLEQGCKTYPTSNHYYDAQELIYSIKNTELSAELKGDVFIDQHNLISIRSKNIDSVHLSIYHVEALKNDTSQNFFKGYDLKQVHTNTIHLSKNGQYNQHTKDFILPNWKQTGKFIVLISENLQTSKRVLTEDSISPDLKFSYVFVDVHDFKVVNKTENEQGIIHVLDLKTGNPIKHAKVKITESSISNTYYTDKEGSCVFPFEMYDTYNYTWSVYHGNDSLTNSNYLYKQQNNSEKIKYKVLTDRELYRPGQTIYYKVIAYKGNSPNNQVAPNQAISITLKDQNELDLYNTDLEKFINSKLTNEFGSYSGSIILPKNGFSLGTLRLTINKETYKHILVEEYKRPTFFIENTSKKNNYHHGDTLSYRSSVTSFAGYPISNAQVKININYNFEDSNKIYQSIKVDTVLKTDANGVFTLNYPTKKNDNYSITYHFSASITSTLGETHHNSLTFYVTQKIAQWDFELPQEILADDTSKIHFKLKVEATKKSTFKLTVLKQNEKRKNIQDEFEEHEFQDFSRTLFSQSFPNSYYFENTKIHSDYDTITANQHTIGARIALNQLTQNSAGRFNVVCTYITENNDTITSNHTFESINLHSDKDQDLRGIWMKSFQKYPEIGDKISILIGTRFNKQKIYYRLYNNHSLLQVQSKIISKRLVINHRVTKADLDGLTLEVMFVKNGYTFTKQLSVPISQTSRKIALILETKRDFLSPGNKEKWILSTHSSSLNEKELVASMMDASLDQIHPSNWDLYFPSTREFFHSWNTNNDYQSYYFESPQGWEHPFLYYINAKGDTVHTVSIDSEIIISEKYSTSQDEFNVGEGGRGFGVGNGQGNVRVKKFRLQTAAKMEPPVIVNIEVDEVPPSEQTTIPKKSPRTNFNETAFFYPNLYADKDGKFSFEFTLPDALTTWKFRALAHDKEMNIGQLEEFFIAQKELMVQPNAPRFFRAGDNLEFSANVVNVSDKNLPVKVSLEWFNPFTNEVIPEVFGKMETLNLQLNAKKSQTVSWKLSIPENGLDLIAYRIKASSESFTDSEEKAFPILSNRVFVTEALPITIEEKGNYTFTLDKLATSTSTTKQHENLVFDYASNTIWSVVKTLPAASKVNYPSSDALFHAYYTNVLGSKVLANNPAIKQMIAHWNVGTSELTNPTIANSVDLTETPWVNAAQSESEQRKEIAFFLEENNLANQQKSYLEQLFQQRTMDGAWPWFAGGQASAYITNDIVFGFAQLNERPTELDASLNYLNNYYTYEFKKHTATENNQRNWLSEQELQWLFIQAAYQLPANEFTTLLAKTLAKTWTTLNLKQQAIAGMYLLIAGDKAFASKIAASIQNRATKRKNTGTYWNEKYYSNTESIETQAYILAFFTALGLEKPLLNSIQLSLLNKKRGQLWENSSTTARVVHSLLSVPATDFSAKNNAIIRIGNETITKATNEVGELTQTWTKKEITPALGNVVINQTAETPSFGSLTYSYTENIEHVTNSTTGLVLTKEIYLIQGEQEILVTPTTKLKVGDQLRIYLKVTNDRAIDFVHIKDLKAAGMENVNQLSSYGYGKNVSYYTTPYDNRTSFFIEHLPKGKSSVSYDVRLTHKGTQSIGYALVECLYALEFRGNTRGMKVVVE